MCMWPSPCTVQTGLSVHVTPSLHSADRVKCACGPVPLHSPDRVKCARDTVPTESHNQSPVLAASLAQWLRRPPRERQTRGSIPAFSVGDYSWSSHTSDLKIGTPVATLPGVIAGTG